VLNFFSAEGPEKYWNAQTPQEEFFKKSFGVNCALQG
jgi:hypothetical protein